jgi:outer membrane lipoprotein LolB
VREVWHFWARRLLAAGVMLVLTACASVAPSRSVSRDDIGEFSLQARLAITRGEERVALAIDWQHQGARDDITVRSPLGQTVAHLQADARGARLELADRQAWQAPNLDALTERALGTALPLSGLPHWVLGRAAAPERGERDALGRWKQFHEAGWQVVFAEYESDAIHALPRLIDLARDDVRVRIRADEWTVR